VEVLLGEVGGVVAVVAEEVLGDSVGHDFVHVDADTFSAHQCLLSAMIGNGSEWSGMAEAFAGRTSVTENVPKSCRSDN
jgi:hypothetical protein